MYLAKMIDLSTALEPFSDMVGHEFCKFIHWYISSVRDAGCFAPHNLLLRLCKSSTAIIFGIVANHRELMNKVDHTALWMTT